MRRIIIHGFAQDNRGSYHKAGAVLTIDDDGGKGTITEAAATAMLKSRSASLEIPAKAPPQPK